MSMFRVYALQMGAVHLMKSSPARDRAVHIGEFLCEQGWQAVVVECDEEGVPLRPENWEAWLSDCWARCHQMLLVDGISWAPAGEVPFEFPALNLSPPAPRKRAKAVR